MDMPEEPPTADPEEPQASRLTTIVLIVSLVLVVIVAGVAGTVAVLMTRNPDAPLFGGTPPQRLAVPVHFAPVRETKPAPCPGDPAVLDEEQTTCYLLEDGVTVGAVQRVQPVRENDGTYSVRIAVASGFKERLVQLMDELAPEQRQVAVVLAPEDPQQPKTVLVAPVVTQPMDGDSLSIAGFTEQDAQALTARLLGAPTPTASPDASQPAATGAPQPTTPIVPTTGGTGGTGTGIPGTGTPGVGNTGGPVGTGGTGGSGSTGTGTGTGTGTPGGTGGTAGTGGTGGTGTGQPGATGVGRVPDKRYASCKEAVAAGDGGPYYQGTHEEYSWYPDLDRNGVACNSADIR